MRHHGAMAPDTPPGHRESAADAVSALVERYAGLVRRAVHRVAGYRAHAVADDIAQVVMTAMWRQLQREQIIAAPSSYIYKAAIREAVRAMKREAHRAETPLDEAEAEAAGGSDPHQALHARELAEAIEAAVSSLQRDRQRAVRAHLTGLELEEIMRLHAWSYQRARNLVARGMHDLRHELQRRGVPQ